MRIGIVFRPELAVWLTTRPREVECVELRIDRGAVTPRFASGDFAAQRPVVLNAPRLSLGATAPLDPRDLCDVLRAARAVDAVWISAYLGSRRRPEVELSYPDPVVVGRAALGRAIATCRRIMDACSVPVLVENVAAFGGTDGSMALADFVNRLCDETGCGVLVDVTALAVDARYGLDPRVWLCGVEPRHVVALRLGGWREGGKGHWAGQHEGRIAADAWALARELAGRAPLSAVILQSEGRFPGVSEIRSELHRLAALDPLAHHDDRGLDRVHDGGQVRWRQEPARL